MKKIFNLLLAAVFLSSLLIKQVYATEPQMAIQESSAQLFGGYDPTDWLWFDETTGEIYHVDPTVTTLNIPAEIDGVTVRAIRDYAFMGCTALEHITLPDGLSTIGTAAFADCTNLKDITIPGSVSTLSMLLFSNCTSMASVIIQDGVTEIGFCAFTGCGALKNIVIPDSVVVIRQAAFENCSSLASITIPTNVEGFYDTLTGCSSLTEIIVAEENNHYASRDGVLFNNEMSMLFRYPAGNTSPSYVVPDHVWLISDGAFQGCSYLTDVTIPESLCEIWEGAFLDCDNLTDVYYSGTEAQWNAIYIGDNNDPLLNATVHFNSSPTVTVKGTLGDNEELNWVYKGGNLTFLDPIPEKQTIYVALEENSRFSGIHSITADKQSANVGTGSNRLKLIWLDELLIPQCKMVPLEL